MKDLKDYEQQSAIGLKYEKNGDAITVKNKMNELVAELSWRYINQGVYNDVWFGYVTSEEYKEIMQGAYLDYFRDSKTHKKLCNTLKLTTGMEDETAAWFNATLLPQLIEAGLQYNALVIPENIFAQLSLTENFNSEGYFKMFPSEQDALNWLKSK